MTLHASGLVGVLCVVACARNSEIRPTPGPTRASEYYPLAVGNHWTYQANSLGEKGERRVEIVGEKAGFYLDNQGGELAVDALGVRDRRRYLLQDPIEVGHTWSSVVSVSSIERYEVKGVGTTCQVPAGVFQNCVTVESRSRVDENTTLVNELTFAPTVGIVRVEMAREAGGKRIPQHQLALKEFEVKPPPAPRPLPR